MGVHVFPILNPASHLPSHPIPQGPPCAPALSALSHASNLDWRPSSHMVIYITLDFHRALHFQVAEQNTTVNKLHKQLKM